jgi:hypothetical protein
MSYYEVLAKESAENLKKLKNITIRGIDSDTYEDFSSKVKSLNKNIGDAVTQMMKDILVDFDDAFPTLSSKDSLRKLKSDAQVISHHERLDISKQDLEDAGVPFAFRHIERLTIGPDVDLETFNKYIVQIQHCSRVKIPAIQPKLVLLSRIRFCDRVEVYPVTSESDSTSSKYDSYEEE